jgi:hypothetical protein
METVNGNGFTFTSLFTSNEHMVLGFYNLLLLVQRKKKCALAGPTLQAARVAIDSSGLAFIGDEG